MAPFRQRTDYPPPNDLLLEFGRSVAGAALGLPAGLLISVIANGQDSIVWLGLYAASLGASLVWLFRRFRADDRRSQEILTRRLLDEANDRIHDHPAV